MAGATMHGVSLRWGLALRLCAFVERGRVALQPVDEALQHAVEIPIGAPQCAFPDRRDAPAAFAQRGGDFRVVAAVAADLVAPEVDARLRPFEQVAIVAVPETAMHE